MKKNANESKYVILFGCHLIFLAHQIFLSRTTEPILTKLGTGHPWMKEIIIFIKLVMFFLLLLIIVMM